ncbi:MAG: helix-turn-helix domain-containing protein, partial [Bacteroidales bacterium]|nr:helix-turn-helix domain-containing protein [Bacteroidales bacterium]
DVPLPKIIKALNYMSMMFIERIKQLREQCQMPQQQLAAALEMDQATCCKIEKGERRAKHEQVYIIAGLLKIDKDELLSLWLADQVYSVVKDEKHASKALHGVDYLRLVVRNDYRGNNDFSKIFQFFETLYINGRLQLPLKGIVFDWVLKSKNYVGSIIYSG